MMAHVIRMGTAAARCGALALAGLLAVSGCSALSGRNVGPSVSNPGPAVSSSSPPPHGQAAFTDDVTVSAVLSDARNDFETVETFDYRDLSKYRRAGIAATTSPYTDKYEKLFTTDTENGVRRTKTVEVASVDVVGIADLDPHAKAAVALAHAKLTVSSSQSTTPQISTITAVLKLRQTGGKWRISDFSTGAKTHGTIPANNDLRSAISAARAGLAKILGLRRRHFDSDFDAALKHTTGDLHDQLVQQQSDLKKKQDDGGYDLTSKFVGFAAAKADGTSAELVVAVDEYRVGRQGAKFGPYHLTFDLTMTNPRGTWLMSEATRLT